MMMVGWILTGLLLGVLIGRAMHRCAPPSLCERLDALGVLRGKDYATIRDTAGGVPVSTALQADGSRLCVWEEEGKRRLKMSGRSRRSLKAIPRFPR